MGIENSKRLNFDFDDVVREKPNRLRDLWETIYDKIYWKTIGWRIKEFRSSVSKLIRWFPIIWKDRDWDDHYIWEIMKNKLRWQAKYIGDRDLHTRAAMDAKRMRLCANLMDKVQDGFYSGEYMDYHETKWDFLDIPDKPGFKGLDMETTSERFDDYFKKYPLVYKKVLTDKKLQIFGIEPREGENDAKQRIAMNIGRYNHERARKLLFRIMEENIEGWWD
jgi:hypothetical protein